MYGKFHPASSEEITNIDGQTVTLNNPPGFGGLFRACVYDSNDTRILYAEDYFMDLAIEDGLDTFAYWDIINESIELYCTEHFEPLVAENSAHTYQCGFGGDEGDGLIDFWLPTPILDNIPDIPVIINSETYILKWRYVESE